MIIESLDIDKIFQNTCNREEIQPQDYTFLHPDHIYQSIEMAKALLDYNKHTCSGANKQDSNGINLFDLVSFKPHRVLLQEIAAQFTVYAVINNVDNNDRNVYILTIYRSIILSVEPLILNKGEFSRLYDRKYSEIKEESPPSFIAKNFPLILTSILEMQETGIIDKNVNPIDLSREIVISTRYNSTIRKDIGEYTKKKIDEFVTTTHTFTYENSLKLRIPSPIKERNTLFIVGGPGSGKTSHVNRLKINLENISDYVEISTDSYKVLLMSPPLVPKLMLGYSQLAQSEASFIKGQALKLAIEKNMHILLDQVSFSSHILEQQKIQQGIIKITVISAKINVALERSNKRGLGIGRFEDTCGIINKHKNTVIEVIQNIRLLLTKKYKDAKIIFQDNSGNNHQEMTEFMEINCTQKKVIIKDRELLENFFKNKFLLIPKNIDVSAQPTSYYEKTEEKLREAVDEELRNFFKKVRKCGGKVYKLVRKSKADSIEKISNKNITTSYSNIASSFKPIGFIDKEEAGLRHQPKRVHLKAAVR